MQFETESTICAIATGNPISTGGRGAVRGALRISGPGTRKVLETLFPQLIQAFCETRHAKRFATIIHLPELGSIEVGLYYWPDYRSYTGQPSAELHLLGAPILLEQVQSRLMEAGARMAKPGEFTLRAYLAGRLDLTQCEAVLGVIHAHSQREFEVALAQLAGGLATPLKGLRQDLINLLADLEAGLDFVDEDIEFVNKDEIVERLQIASRSVEALQEQIENRQGQGVDFQVAIVGPPNAGKSSLVNALSSADVAITSPVPGTTRDYVRSKLRWDDAVIDLLDTAGLESVFESGPRAIAQEKTLAVIQQADLVVVCSSVQEPADLEPLKSCPRLWGVWTKCDLAPSQELRWTHPVEQSFNLSVHQQRGLTEFRQALVDALKDWQQQGLDVVPMTGARCNDALRRASECLKHACQAVLDAAGDEIVAGELRLALEELGEVAGTVANNDVLDALFSRFCIGK